jgi:hypothetical protein
MKVVNINLVVSPETCRLIIDNNIKAEQEIIDYETLFRHIDQATQGTVNVNFHYEWTHDMDEWDNNHSDVVVLSAGEAEVTSIGEPVVEYDVDECEHLHVEDHGAGQSPRLECWDCGNWGDMEFGDESG